MEGHKAVTGMLDWVLLHATEETANVMDISSLKTDQVRKNFPLHSELTMDTLAHTLVGNN